MSQGAAISGQRLVLVVIAGMLLVLLLIGSGGRGFAGSQPVTVTLSKTSVESPPIHRSSVAAAPRTPRSVPNPPQVVQVQDNRANNDIPGWDTPGAAGGPFPPHERAAKQAMDDGKLVEYDSRPELSESDRKALCADLKQLRLARYVIPSDITNLLPLLRSFLMGWKDVMELGSRFGGSTSALTDTDIENFITVDLIVTPAVHALHKLGAACRPNVKRSSVQGNDLTVKLPVKEVDVLFLDTLHTGWLLFSELQRYPQMVKHKILFHDPSSYINSDESDSNAAPYDWGPGLRRALLSFLRNNTDTWEEEVYYPHNSGLLVLRRKDSPVGGRAVLADINWEAREDELGDKLRTGEMVDSDAQRTEDTWLRGEEMVCRNLISKHGCSLKDATCRGLCAKGLYSFHSPFHKWYTRLIDMRPDELPMAPLMPSVYGYHFVVYNRMPVNSWVAVVGCLPSIIVASMHASSILGLKIRMVGDSCDMLQNNYRNRNKISTSSEGWKAPLVVMPLSAVAQHFQGAVSQDSTIIVMVVGTGEPSEVSGKVDVNGFVVDSAVTNGVGYVIFRRPTYNKHRYLNFDEPASSIPNVMRYHYPNFATGSTQDHPKKVASVKVGRRY